MTLGFINHASTQPRATFESYSSIREYYPDSPFFFSVDGDCEDLYIPDIESYLYENVEWLINEDRLTYPPYKKDQILEWLKRMYIGMLKLDTDHVMMVEDDCLILGPIQYPENVECFGHNITIGNDIHGTLLHEIESFARYTPKTTKYGAGGGSIFKCSTFFENYARVTQYIDKNWYLFEEYYWPQCGYMDCYLVLYYLLCGKDYTPNKRMINLWPADHSTPPEELIKMYSGDIDIIHNWKFYYV